jgi:hypothetical protein
MTLSIKKSASNARKVLIIVWFGFFIINLSAVLYLYLGVKWIERDNFKIAVEHLSNAYAPYIGAITMFYWASSRKKQSREKGKAGTALTLALICSVIWNGMHFLFIIPLIFQSGTIEASFENVKEIGAILSWLVGGAIGYYFANPSSSTK